jgi:hypothetical protein
MTPESLQGLSEIAGVVAVAVLGALGGYRAKGMRKAPEQCDTCDKHPDMMVAVSKISDVHDMVEALTKRVDSLMDQAFTIMRSHERSIGRLQGVFGRIDGDTGRVEIESGRRQ